MKLPKFKKKVVAGALAAGLVMGAGGIAAAYFTAGGSGSASATVGNSVPLSVTQTNVMSTFYIDHTNKQVTALYPGGMANPYFKIQNLSHSPEHAKWTLANFSIVTHGATIAATKTGKTAVSGCHAAWFNLSANGTTAGTRTLQAGGTGDTPTPSGSTSAIASVNLIMTNGTTAANGTNQDACEGHTPIVTLSFNS